VEWEHELFGIFPMPNNTLQLIHTIDNEITTMMASNTNTLNMKGKGNIP